MLRITTVLTILVVPTKARLTLIPVRKIGSARLGTSVLGTYGWGKRPGTAGITCKIEHVTYMLYVYYMLYTIINTQSESKSQSQKTQSLPEARPPEKAPLLEINMEES